MAKMRTRLKKLLAVTLAVSMTMSLLNLTAFATDEGEGPTVQVGKYLYMEDLLAAYPEPEETQVQPVKKTSSTIWTVSNSNLSLFSASSESRARVQGKAAGTSEVTRNTYYYVYDFQSNPSYNEHAYYDLDQVADVEDNEDFDECFTLVKRMETWTVTIPRCEECSFKASDLNISYDSDGAVTGGVLTETCSKCKATQTTPLSADEVQAYIDNKAATLALTKYTVSKANASAGEKLSYNLQLNNNGLLPLENLSLTFTFSEGLEFTNYSSKKVVYFSGNYKGSVIPEYSVATASYDEENRQLTITIPGMVKSSNLSATLYATVDADVELGSDLITAFSVTMDGEPLSELSRDTSVHINKFKGTTSIYLAGAKMGYWYNNGTPSTATMSIGNSKSSLDLLENTVFSFENAFNKTNNPNTGYVSNSDVGTYYGEFVLNLNDRHTWQCVGFIPYYGAIGNGDYEVLEPKVYTSDDDYSYPSYHKVNFTSGSLADAQQYVTDQNGVLYGQTVTLEQLRALENNISNGRVTIMTVWYVADPLENPNPDPENPNPEGPTVDKIDYGSLSISSVDAMTEQATSAGVTFSHTPATYLDQVFRSEITITITEDAPDSVHINLNDVLQQVMKEMSAADGPNQIQPGDKMIYTFRVVNNSGRAMDYVNDSVQVGTVNSYTGGTSLGSGFEGYAIPAPVLENGTSYSFIPRRVINEPLRYLGVTNDISDDAIGALLAQLGYGSGEDLSNAEITQTYLGCYYLDYFNTHFRSPNNAATSFQDLTDLELASLTANASGARITETCQEAAEALYYAFYGSVYTFNGLTLYEQMADNTQLNSQFAQAYNNDEVFTLTTRLEAFTTNNGFQNMKFGFGMAFDLKYEQPQTPPSGGDDGGDDNYTPEDTPTVDVPDEETPTTEAPVTEEPVTEEPVTELPEEEIPKADVPATGDPSLLWLAASALSGSGLAWLALSERKGKRED
ncbi:hypothetical protein [Flavonifractor sp. An100]|uniref:hypothetical protein n=1 Tax=Flavonifractor sp. An100 TaxID=1965538 RepID=UPI000B5835EC|nr:hypothetical protein [Flavonifractor sp. An100]OUQ82444.1 hypothetical protein B5E43_00375 [Flavonifractor sp. An100]